ncbi:MAG: hypothetical protein JJU11_03850, partial [Candidatus Sumerlaeia bacterium]|nr:hypothetical protein [Candidatus Sumerlaeia bacterium]
PVADTTSGRPLQTLLYPSFQKGKEVMKKSTLLSAVALLAMGFTAANAQQLYITGDVTGNFAPGTATFADGQVATTEIDGDVGVLNQKTVPAADHGLTAGTLYQYKIAASDWNPEFPAGNNQWLILPDANVDVTFYLDRSDPQDGFSPANNFVYSSATGEFLAAADKIALVGDFYSAFDPPLANWAAGSEDNILLTNAGSGDTEDGLLGATFTGLEPGNYEFLILVNPDDADPYERKIAEIGMSQQGANLSFTVVDEVDNVTVLLDAATARWSIANDNPTLSAGPPFLANIFV